MGETTFLDELFKFYLEDWGWVFFSIAAGIIFLILLVDNLRRQLRATFWLLALFLCLLAFIPGAIYTISSAEARESLQDQRMLIFYLGILGGILPPLMAVGYWITYKGMTAPAQAVAPNYYGGDLDSAATAIEQDLPPEYGLPADARRYGAAPEPPPELVAARLVNVDNPQASYQLRKGKTQFGRGPENDYPIPDDAVSKRHIMIRQDGSQFVIQDVGSSFGTLLNSIPVDGKETLKDGDIITLGNTRLRFTSGEG